MKKIFVITTLVISAASLRAEESHCFQASLTPDIAIYPKTAQINGLSLSIWGQNPQQGIAVGIVNGSTGDSAGFSWGLVNYSETYTGVSWAWVNVNQTSFTGWEYGLVNVARGDFTGFQSGWIFNYAGKMKGLQLGLVNYSQNLQGVQIGLANIAINNGWFNEFPDKLATGFPIVNWSF
ncbi:MAG: hypothetical protein WDM80_07025 [Limisphaerales bacterium]